jgi:hypothetical protein
MTSLSFALRNDSVARAGDIPMIYAGDHDVAGELNTLVLTITVAGASGLTLAASSDTNAGDGVAVNIDFGTAVRHVGMVKPRLEGWTATLVDDDATMPAFWQLRPQLAVVLAEGQTLVIALDGVVGDPDAKPSDSIVVSVENFPKVRPGFGDEATLAVAIADPPGAEDKDLTLELAWVDSSNGTPAGKVVVSRLDAGGIAEPVNEIGNELVFTITNPNRFEPLVAPDVPWIPGKPPTFTISFSYAKAQPGYHRLATEQRAKIKNVQPELSTPVEYNAYWNTAETQYKGNGLPFWTFQPNPDTNHVILGAHPDDASGDGTTDSPPLVQLCLTKIVSDLRLDQISDTTAMYLQWENIPGYRPSSMVLDVQKIDTFSLTSLTTDPSSKEPIAAGTPVTLRWLAHGAETFTIDCPPGTPLVDTAGRTWKDVAAGTLPAGEQPEMTFVMQPGQDTPPTVTLIADRLGQPEQLLAVAFTVTYGIVFTQQLWLADGLNITHPISGVTDPSAATGPPARLSLNWTVDHPEWVKFYTVKLVGEQFGPPLTTDGQPVTSWTVDLPANYPANLDPNKINYLDVTLCAHGHDDVALAESAAITPLTLYPPVSSIRIDVKAKAFGTAIELPWGLLVRAFGDAVGYRVHGDLASRAWEWSLVFEGQDGTVVRPLTDSPPSTPMRRNADGSTSYFPTETASFDYSKVSLRVQGLGGDVAVFPYVASNGQPGAIRTVDRFLRGMIFRFVPPSGGQIAVPEYGLPWIVKPFDIYFGTDLWPFFVGEADRIMIRYTTFTPIDPGSGPGGLFDFLAEPLTGNTGTTSVHDSIMGKPVFEQPFEVSWHSWGGGSVQASARIPYGMPGGELQSEYLTLTMGFHDLSPKIVFGSSTDSYTLIPITVEQAQGGPG